MNQFAATALGLGVLAGLLTIATVANGDQPEPSPFDKQLQAVAKEYKSYRPVDSDLRWAPTSCIAPIRGDRSKPGQARLSASKDDETHGRKIYFLFAKHQRAYLGLAEKPQTEGQAIVKESWTPEEATPEEFKQFQLDAAYNTPIPFVRLGDKLYKAGKQRELFIMLKLDPKTEGTDQGWVYGTVMPDGKTVTAAGRIESCMGCHAQAKKDRLFGLTTTEPAKDTPKTAAK